MISNMVITLILTLILITGGWGDNIYVTDASNDHDTSYNDSNSDDDCGDYW